MNDTQKDVNVVVLVGIGAVLVALALGVAVFEDATNPAETITAVIGPAITAIGTMVGFVAGNKQGTEGRKDAENRADEARKQAGEATTTAAKLTGFVHSDENIRERARKALPELFRQEGQS